MPIVSIWFLIRCNPDNNIAYLTHHKSVPRLKNGKLLKEIIKEERTGLRKYQFPVLINGHGIFNDNGLSLRMRHFL
ncbi:hypothetical protein HanIR_Chr03g0105581 [Helianthus annuus]|nr:hypothetical protein HanIR_Chr03g0105581 [Helianthus annuus]